MRDHPLADANRPSDWKPRRRIPLADRLWSRVNKTETCWLWTGTRVKHYGHIYVAEDHRQHYVHRVSWRLAYGPIPDGLFVCHKCDVPLCVRPDHLFVGTQAENLADMASKGRGSNQGPKGERNGRAILTETDAIAILGSDEPHKEIAERLGVSSCVVIHVRLRHTWMYIQGPPRPWRDGRTRGERGPRLRTK